MSDVDAKALLTKILQEIEYVDVLTAEEANRRGIPFRANVIVLDGDVPLTAEEARYLWDLAYSESPEQIA